MVAALALILTRIGVECAPIRDASRYLFVIASEDRKSLAAIDSKGAVHVFKIANTGQLVAKRVIRPDKPVPDPEPYNSWSLLSISPDGKRVAIHWPDQPLKVFDARTGRLLSDIPLVSPQTHKPIVPYDLTWQPRTNFVGMVVSDGHTYLQQPNGTQLKILPIKGPIIWLSENRVLGLESFGTVKVVDAKSGNVLRKFEDNSETCGPLALSPDHRFLAGEGEDPMWSPPTLADDLMPTEAALIHTLKTKIWRVSDGKLITTFDGYESNDAGELLFMPHNRIALVDRGDTYDIATGKVISHVSSPNRWQTSGYRMPAEHSHPFFPTVINLPKP